MSDTKVKTGKVRASYVAVFQPRAVQEGGKEKYSISLIIPKKDKKTITAIEKAIKAAAELGKESRFGGKIPRNLKTPLRDGDEDRDEDEAYQDSMFVNANSDRRPAVIGLDKEAIIDEDEFYSGCYCKATINFYAYNSNGSKGVAAGLGNILKLEDGDPLGSSLASAEDDFADDFDDYEEDEDDDII